MSSSVDQTGAQAKLPPGATQEDLEQCKQILWELTNAPNQTETARRLLYLIYAKGGDYSSHSLRMFAEGYLQ